MRGLGLGLGQCSLASPPGPHCTTVMRPRGIGKPILRSQNITGAKKMRAGRLYVWLSIKQTASSNAAETWHNREREREREDGKINTSRRGRKEDRNTREENEKHIYIYIYIHKHSTSTSSFGELSSYEHRYRKKANYDTKIDHPSKWCLQWMDWSTKSSQGTTDRPRQWLPISLAVRLYIGNSGGKKGKCVKKKKGRLQWMADSTHRNSSSYNRPAPPIVAGPVRGQMRNGEFGKKINKQTNTCSCPGRQSGVRPTQAS